MLTKPARVVGIIAAVVAIPLAALAGLDIANSPVWYIPFIVVAVSVIGGVAALWFQFLHERFGDSRASYCLSGALSAVATCLCYAALHATVAWLLGRGSWIAGFLIYATLSLTTLAPFVFGAGLLAGWIASARRFAR